MIFFWISFSKLHGAHLNNAKEDQQMPILMIFDNDEYQILTLSFFLKKITQCPFKKNINKISYDLRPQTAEKKKHFEIWHTLILNF